MAYAPFDLKGKVALITGGNGGIGLGMAEALAQAGADVVIWGSNAEKNLAAEVMAVNLDGVFWTFREACKHMKERANRGDPGGSLVVTSSVSAVHGAPRNQAYAATKGAVIPMIRGIAVEYARYGVRANAILPGWIATDMTAGAQQNETFNAKAIGRVPMRRWGEPEDFGGIAVYLASDASKFHTADTFVIDGGYTVY